MPGQTSQSWNASTGHAHTCTWTNENKMPSKANRIDGRRIKTTLFGIAGSGWIPFQLPNQQCQQTKETKAAMPVKWHHLWHNQPNDSYMQRWRFPYTGYHFPVPVPIRHRSDGGETRCCTHNNNNKQICIAPQGRNFRGDFQRLHVQDDEWVWLPAWNFLLSVLNWP